MALNPTEIIRSLYAGVGEPGFSERERLHRMQRNCLEYKDHKTCYLVLKMGPTPAITWRHLTKEHFGIDDLGYEDYLKLVHPAWMQLYLGFGMTAYQVAHYRPDFLRQKGVTFAQKVPLLCGGEYFWYDQIAIPASTDGKGHLAAHLNYYRQIAPYHKYEPDFPSLTAMGKPDSYLDHTFALAGMRLLPTFLSEFLTKGQIQFMDRYRSLPEVKNGKQPARSKVLAGTQINSLENLGKIQQRIRTNLIEHFDGFQVDTAHKLALFLNDFFPA